MQFVVALISRVVAVVAVVVAAAAEAVVVTSRGSSRSNSCSSSRAGGTPTIFLQYDCSLQLLVIIKLYLVSLIFIDTTVHYYPHMSHLTRAEVELSEMYRYSPSLACDLLMVSRERR